MNSTDLFQVILVGALLLALVLSIFFYRAWRKTTQNRADESFRMIVTISEADLREMEKKGLVTAEEAARIRKKQSERTRKLAAQLDAPPSPPSSQIAIPDVPPEPVRRALPPHLEALVGRDERELEDLHNAGFLKDDDYQQVLEARRV